MKNERFVGETIEAFWGISKTRGGFFENFVLSAIREVWLRAINQLLFTRRWIAELSLDLDGTG